MMLHVDNLSAMDSACRNSHSDHGLYPIKKFHINVSQWVIHMIYDFFTANREEIVFKEVVKDTCFDSNATGFFSNPLILDY
jgi:hypothetical protein